MGAMLDALLDLRDPAQAPKRKRKRKRPDYAQLVLPRTGRLTPAYWLLKEGFTQDLRKRRADGIGGRNLHYDWQQLAHISALTSKGYLEEVKGPRGGLAYRTTGEGAFAMLIAEGQHEAKKQSK